MKRFIISTIKAILISSGLLLFLVTSCGIYSRITHVKDRYFFKELDRRLAVGEKRIPIAELAPFEWEFVCVQHMYGRQDPIGLLTGKFYSPMMDEVSQIIMFIKNNEQVYEIEWVPMRKGHIATIGCAEREKAFLEKEEGGAVSYYTKRNKKLKKNKPQWDPEHFLPYDCIENKPCYGFLRLD